MQEPVERPHTERSHRQQLDALRVRAPAPPPTARCRRRAAGRAARARGLAASRRSANASALADDASSHCTSSIASSTGASLAEHVQHVAHRDAEGAVVDRFVCGFLAQQRNLERAPPRHRQQRQRRRRGPPRRGRPARRARDRARPPRAATRARPGRARARGSTPSSQSVDLPIPASPSSTSPAAPSAGLPTKAWTEASSCSLPTISDGIFDWIVPGDAAGGNRRTRCVDCSRGGNGGSRAGWRSARSSRSCSPSGWTTLCTAAHPPSRHRAADRRLLAAVSKRRPPADTLDSRLCWR